MLVITLAVLKCLSSQLGVEDDYNTHIVDLYDHGKTRERRKLSCSKLRVESDSLCKRLGLGHIRIQLYTPKTNGKAERFIQTNLREWAYAQTYPDLTPTKSGTDPLAASLQLARTSRRYR
jgi:hypothetical protein